MRDFTDFLGKIPNLISCDLSRADLSEISDDIDPALIVDWIRRLGKTYELELPALLNLSPIKQAWADKGLKPKNLRFVSH